MFLPGIRAALWECPFAWTPRPPESIRRRVRYVGHALACPLQANEGLQPQAPSPILPPPAARRPPSSGLSSAGAAGGTFPSERASVFSPSSARSLAAQPWPAACPAPLLRRLRLLFLSS